jgi:hypothetical protein
MFLSQALSGSPAILLQLRPAQTAMVEIMRCKGALFGTTQAGFRLHLQQAIN